jgi:hypothetical protein
MRVRRAGAVPGGVVAILAAVLSFAYAGDIDGPTNSIQPVKRIPFTADLGLGKPPTHELNTIRDVHDAFFACWKAPPKDEARAGTEINIVFSLSRSGEIIGEPRFTVTPLEMSTEVRAIYQRSVIEAFRLCSPFPVSASLGNAIAGKPHSLRLTDGRGQPRI